MFVNFGLIGPKARPNGVADGQQVDIPASWLFCYFGFRSASWGMTGFDMFGALLI
jgi:hypothetical protein